MRRFGGGDEVNDRSAGVIMEVFPVPLKGPRTRPQTAKEVAMAKGSPSPLSYHGPRQFPGAGSRLCCV